MAVAGGQLHNLGTCFFKSSTLEPSAPEQLRLLGKSIAWRWGNYGDLCAAHVARVQCEAGIKCLLGTEKQEGPTQVVQKHGHKFHMGMREPNGET